MTDSPSSEVSPDNDNARTGNHKKRVRVWTEDDRAKHRVLEKSRREAFSDNLMSLARLLPNLASVKESKLSKHTIVDESLKYHQLQQARLDELQNNVDVLEAEKEFLVAELNQWRRCLDTPPQQAPVTIMDEFPAAHESDTHVIPTILEATDYSGHGLDSNMAYGGPLMLESGEALEQQEAPASTCVTMHSFPGTVLGTRQLDAYVIQETDLSVSETPAQTFSFSSQQQPIHIGTEQGALWDAHVWPQQRDREASQAVAIYQTYQNLPFESHPS